MEIRRVVTYIRDEDKFLRSKEAVIMLENPGLARQVGIHRMERGRFNARHMERFRKLASLPGYSGTILPGTSTKLSQDHDGENTMDVDEETVDCYRRGVDSEDDEEDQDQEDEDLEALVAALVSLTVEPPAG